MGYNNPDLYYQPEAFGLTPIGELNDPEASYSFYDFIVWKHEDGRIFYASDSGCSCPSPFEDYTSLDKADEAKSIEEFEAAVKSYFNSVNYDSNWDDDIQPSRFQSLKAEAIELVNKVSKLL